MFIPALCLLPPRLAVDQCRSLDILGVITHINRLPPTPQPTGLVNCDCMLVPARDKGELCPDFSVRIFGQVLQIRGVQIIPPSIYELVVGPVAPQIQHLPPFIVLAYCHGMVEPRSNELRIPHLNHRLMRGVGLVVTPPQLPEAVHAHSLHLPFAG